MVSCLRDKHWRCKRDHGATVRQPTYLSPGLRRRVAIRRLLRCESPRRSCQVPAGSFCFHQNSAWGSCTANARGYEGCPLASLLTPHVGACATRCTSPGYRLLTKLGWRSIIQVEWGARSFVVLHRVDSCRFCRFTCERLSPRSLSGARNWPLRKTG